ncbi:Beta-Casp domain-containing protein [Heracleum sosnowskyi]|uniref:Beta-Casp domain-containing protein n=1 Tax=Heracleum sosnowskyi TaxID=360622 RepID=A0AAD8J314_9APIA|nr:Beta-Casp domain-containing protein [Heracleum sosnowskyi]
MKFTSLSKGKGFYFPPCHLLNICGFRVLFDCPLDLSALSIFSPVGIDEGEFRVSSCDDFRDSECSDKKRQKAEKPLDASNLIHAEPYYKTVNDLHLWNASFIDIVVISSYMGMLGLPFLTRKQGFSAKIYATEATARLGKLMMEDLVAMHAEFRQLYGPEESGSTQWMKWEELDMFPSVMKEIVIGKDGTELGSWMPLYSAADVMDCMQKVQALKYAEEACYNGTLLIMAVSSGLELGTCNWTISSPKGTVTYLSSSSFVSSMSTDFDYHALQGSDMIIYSDFTTWKAGNGVDDYIGCSAPSTYELSDFSNSENDWEVRAESLLKLDDGAEEVEKLSFLCSCSIDSIKAGGSVIIPIGRLGIILQLLEQIADSLEATNNKAPIFVISSVADELLAYTNIIPEWLCKQRQDRMYSGHSLFGHVDLLKDKTLQLFPTLHSLELLKSWEEPCIVFCPHWSMRLGPAVHLLRRWCGDPNSLLIIENEEYTDLALLPFKPMTIKALQCSFLSGIKLQKVQPLLNILQPKVLMIPEDSRQFIPTFNTSMSLKYFSGKETLCIPKYKTTSELDIATDLTLQIQWKKLRHKETSIARLKGQLLLEHGKQRLVFHNDQEASMQAKSLLHWGKLDLKSLLVSLQKMGINGFVEQENIDTESETPTLVHISEPRKALIEMKGTDTVISTDDEDLASLICRTICSNLDCI